MCPPVGFNCPLLNNTAITVIIEHMATLHMTEAELVKNITAVLAKVREGAEIVIEEDCRAIAVIKPSASGGRLISDILQDARQRNSTITLDEDFGKDMEEIIASHQQPWNPPSWD